MAHPSSQLLYEAIMNGDQVEADRLKEEINSNRVVVNTPKAKANVVNFNTVLNDDKSSAKSVYQFLNKAFGSDWWEWEFETLERMLWIKFGVALEDAIRDKVFAIRHLCISDQAFWDWNEFNQISLSFAGAVADFDMIRKPSPGMVINAVKTMNFIRPERHSAFGNDTVKYICILLKEDGIYCPPPSLKAIVEETLSEMVSEETVSLWKDVNAKYEDLVKGGKVINEDSVIDIQARRILSAEASAMSYGS